MRVRVRVRNRKRIGTKQMEISLQVSVGCPCLLSDLDSAKAFKAIKHNFTRQIMRYLLVSRIIEFR